MGMSYLKVLLFQHSSILSCSGRTKTNQGTSGEERQESTNEPVSCGFLSMTKPVPKPQCTHMQQHKLCLIRGNDMLT
jgi:hypothetical protein